MDQNMILNAFMSLSVILVFIYRKSKNKNLRSKVLYIN